MINLSWKNWYISRAHPRCIMTNPRLVRVFPWNRRSREGRIGERVRNVVWRHGEEHLPSNIHMWTSAGRITMQLGAIQLAVLETAHPSAFITQNYMCSLPVTVSLSVTSGNSSLLDLQLKELHFLSFFSRDPNPNSETWKSFMVRARG